MVPVRAGFGRLLVTLVCTQPDGSEIRPCLRAPAGGAVPGFKNPSRPSLGYRRNTLGVASDSTPKCPNRRALKVLRSLARQRITLVESRISSDGEEQIKLSGFVEGAILQPCRDC